MGITKSQNKKQLHNRIEYLEENRRFIQNALEMVVSLGDFQENIEKRHSAAEILKEAEKRIRYLMPFEAQALYLVDQDDSNFLMSVCNPEQFRPFFEEEISFMTDKGFFAWALREKKGIFLSSRDHSKRFLLHVIATYRRIRGMFVGLLPLKPGQHIPDSSVILLSAILLNAANAIESLEIYHLLNEQNIILKKRAEELARSQELLQRAQKMEAIGILAGQIAHDLNNILSGVVSYPELLLMKMPEDNPFREHIIKIQKSGERAAAIVQDLLSLAKRGQIIIEPLNINSIVSEYLESTEHKRLMTSNGGIKVKTSLDPGLMNILGSSIHLGKAIMNLIVNAAEAMPDGGDLFITTENSYVEASSGLSEELKEGDYVKLVISDTGVGISQEDRERIFEPFYTVRRKGKKGTGLGMTVVWGTVKDHNGHIEVESAEGKGTGVTLCFPATRKQSIKAISDWPSQDYQGRGEFILLVDDIEEQREIASEMLKSLGYSVASVSSGEEAVEFLKFNRADLIILDMIMEPGMDGLDTYKKILEFTPGQKAIIASGFSETERILEAKRIGVGAYIKKPYLLHKIGQAVRLELER